MSLNLSPDLHLPAPLEGYRLIERLGRGGFGEVWKAEVPGGLFKAIKFVFGDLDNDDEENRAARQEEKALKRVKNIRHPYILSLERYDVIDGQLVIVMELADRNLWDRFRECHSLGMPGIPREELLRYMEEAAEALDLMNTHHSIQHLDVKPQNLFLVYNHVKVGDFGLAKVLEGARGTITGGVTPVYAGPETFNGDVTRYTDQYSLAIVFQEMLTGKRPFNGSNTKQLVMQHLTGIPDLDPLPPADRETILRGLAKEPNHRWPSCTELVRNLRASTSSAQPVTVPKKSGVTAMNARLVASATATVPRVINDTSRRLANPVVSPGIPASTSTPPPILVTPKLVTPQGASNGLPTPATTMVRPVAMATARMSNLGLAQPERQDDGILMPALILGLGETGLRVIQQTRATIIERFGTLDAAPHIRFLYLDTDADHVSSSLATTGPWPLAAHEVMLLKLNRPGHYIQQTSMPSVEQWMPPGLLYRLPRDTRPANGVRAYGRLAFADHYRGIIQRLRQHFESFLSDDTLDSTAMTTGLGVRTNRARVYVIANLAGGSGSGMALDAAYAARRELKQIGYSNPDCVGMFFVPSAEVKGAPLANTCAALLEIKQFQAGTQPYTVRFDSSEPAQVDRSAAFRRTALFQIGSRDSKEYNRSVGLVARAVYLDLFTPVGRRCDEVRVEADRLNENRITVVQPFGLYRLSWPRPAVLAASTRSFTQRLIQRWLTKDASHLREPIQGWLDENWTRKKLALEEVVERFRGAIREHLHEDADRVIAAFIEPLRPQASARRLESQAAADVIHNILELVGKPTEEGDTPGKLHEVLSVAIKKQAKDCESTLYNWTGWFVEQSQYRLPGAEEAVSQITERVKRTVGALEGTRLDLSREVYDGYCRILSTLGNLGLAGRGVIGPSRTTVGIELLETTTQYASKRITLQVLDATLSLYRAMLNVMPDCQREVSGLRNNLTELSLAVNGGGEPIFSPGPGRMILPQGVTSLEAAADQFIGTLPVEDIVEFERELQEDLTKKFGGVVGLCTRPASRPEFLPWIALRSRQFLDSRLEKTDPATVFFRNRDLGAKTERLLVKAFEESAPDVTSGVGRAQTEATILAVPDGPDGERFRELVQSLVPQLSFIPATLPDDIVFMREYPLLPLDELPHLGNVAREVYEQHLTSEHPPHTRTDIAWS